MKFIKIISAIIIIPALVVYLSACSSAEQTTAKLAYNQGDYKKAEIEFDKETKQNPQNEEAWFYLALSRSKLGKTDGVKTAMEQYRKIGKKSFQPELLTEWGTTYDNGYKLYQDGETLAKSGKDAEAVKKFQSSLAAFESAYALLPDSAFVLDNIKGLNNRINTIAVKPIIDKGIALEKEGRYEDAINEYKGGLDKVSKGSSAYETIAYNIGLANLKWGEVLRTAENPDYKNKYEAALPYLEELTSSSDKETKISAYDMLMQVYANLGRTEDAKNAMDMRDKLKAENK